MDGLRRGPRLSPRYFYDRRGSRLFDAITRTPEYYLTRTELAVLRERGDLIGALVPEHAVLVELGSGSADKALALLDNLRTPAAYRPIDISEEALARTVQQVASQRPSLPVSSYWGDFTAEAAYSGLPADVPRLVYYSGSTLGNFEPQEALAFLRALRARLAPGDMLLLGVDLIKEARVLHAAYNDAGGITAEFNKNALCHLNARFEGDFDPEAFEHRAFYQPLERRVEMHLVPRRTVHVRLAGERLRFEPSRPIHTENSYKFTLDDIAGLANRSGFQLVTSVTDERAWFAEALFRA